MGQGTDLGNNIAHLILHLLLGALEALPQVVADTAALEEHGQGLFLGSQGHDALDIFCCAAEERGFQDGFWDGGGFLFLGGGGGGLKVEEGEVDVALEVCWEPWFQGGGFSCS
jgi:hypothetical protein